MTRLVTLAQFLSETDVLNDAHPLFDADTLSVEPGPTPQQCVIHGGSNKSGIRKLVAALDPRHPPVDHPAPKTPDEGRVAKGYPTPSPQALAAAGVSSADLPDDAIMSGQPEGATIGGPSKTAGRKQASQSPSSDSTATYTATAHSDTPAAATSTTPDSAVTKTHEAQASSGIHPGEGAPRAATGDKKEAARQEAEASPTGKPVSESSPKPKATSGAQPGDPSSGQPARQQQRKK